MGYGGADATRQKFTQKERDSESGLDYFLARYYSGARGRFTSPDELLSSGDVTDPQTWNRYSYGLGNPLRYTDPLGLYVFDSSVNEAQRERFRQALARARQNLSDIARKYGTNSTEYKRAKRAIEVYGEEGVRNGVTIRTSEGPSDGRMEVEGVAGRRTTDNPNGQNIRISFKAAAYEASGFDGLIAHEGSHAADASEWVSSGFAMSENPTKYQTELVAYTVTSLMKEAAVARVPAYVDMADVSLPGVRDGRGHIRYLPELIWFYSTSWAEADKETLRKANIDRLLARPRNAGGLYALTPRSPRRSFARGARLR
jgi:RHS repeat-associated protein